MFVYIDATFKMVGNTNYIGVITSDTPGIRNIPPYNLIPNTVMTATSTGDVMVFDDKDTLVLLTKLGEYMEVGPLQGNEACVGWCLDQVVIPSLCANSMTQGVKSVTRWLRRLDAKWSKTMGWSLERAFIQGWYPSDRDALNNQLTLEDALKMCSLPSLNEIASAESDSNMTEDQKVLMSRILAMNKLYDRYHKISTERLV